MRKAFETNVPRLKPRLRNAAAGEQSFDPGAAAGGLFAPDERPPEAAEATADPAAAEVAAEPAAEPIAPVRAEPVPVARRAEPARAVRAAVAPSTSIAAHPERSGREAPAESRGPRQGDVVSRRDRLEKIKRKVADAARPAPRLDPTPSDPARAAESVLSLVGELEAEVSRAREREEALRGDLDGARTELARAAGEARGATERLAAAEQELTEKRGVLSELLAEMEALEQERDEAVRRAQALSVLDEERARILEDVTRRAEEEAKLRADREAEVERLGEELRNSAADGARLRTAVGELARERDQLAGELDRMRGERDELVTAKRALEQVHAALAQARAKLG